MSETSASPFSVRAVVIIIVTGIVCFAAFLILAAYAPDLRSGRDGRAHGLSTSAIGFRGVYELLDATGAEVEYLRTETVPDENGLTIVTLEPGIDTDRVDQLIRDSWGPLLFVLPKWATMAVPGETDRVYGVQSGIGGSAAPSLIELGDISVSTSKARPGSRLISGMPRRTPLRAPEQLQTIAGEELTSLAETGADETVLANVYDTNVYILADPDLINNQALADPARARAAIALLEELNTDGGPYRFDLVANGYGASANLLTLAFEPPFLALTLCILAAALLAGLQAAFRFGPPQREPRAIAFGKRALVDNSAELLRLARREHLSSMHYAELTREAAVAAIGNPRRLEGAELDAWLDGLKTDGEPFTALAARARSARNRQDILGAARALHQWRKAVTHEG